MENRTEKQIMPSKTTITWLFNDIWCYLYIVCFDWKIGVFQQTVAMLYYVFKRKKIVFCEKEHIYPMEHKRVKKETKFCKKLSMKVHLLVEFNREKCNLNYKSHIYKIKTMI